MQPCTRRQEDMSWAWLSALCAHAGSTVTKTPEDELLTEIVARPPPRYQHRKAG